MRIALLVIPFSALFLTACGTTERTVVVQPAAGSTVVVPQNGEAKIIPPNG